MSKMRVPCPRCGQDWLSDIKLLHLRRMAVWCRECDALWVESEPRDDNFEDYGTFMRQHGRTVPEGPGEVEIIGEHLGT